MTPERRHCGFTLLELSIVLIVISLIVAMGLSMGKGVIESTTRTSTNRKLDQLEKTLMDFRTANNRLPCPADATLLESDVNYGVEGVSGGVCTTGSTYDATTGIRTVAANPGPTANNLDKKHSVVEGAVPFKTLNLPKEFIYDGWGRKFAYAVNSRVTAPLAMVGQSLTESCGISVMDASGNPRTTGAVYALLSYGEDGHGGYLKTGARNNAGSTNTGELTNCHCDTANAAETTYASSYVGKDATQNPTTATDQFGDLVRFKERWQMITYDDTYTTSGGPVCQLGFRVDGWIANTYSGFRVTHGDVDGDGIQDLIIGATDFSHGIVYVIFGTKSGFPNPLPLNSLDGTNGFTITHSGQTDSLGQAIAAGDIDHDNNDDILMGGGRGNAYLFYGHARPFTGGASGLNNSTYDLSSTTDCQAFALNNGVYLGGGVAVADVSGHGDGTKDMIVSDYSVDGGKGAVYVVFGKTKTCPGSPTFPLSYDISAIASPNGSIINGPQASGGFDTEQSLSVGDVNNDGFNDIVIQDRRYVDGGTGDLGRIYVVFGQAKASWPSTIDAGALGGSGSDPKGFTVEGPGAWEAFGFGTATGDITGDNAADIVVGSGGAGNIWVIKGHTNPWSSDYYINTMVGNGQAFLLTSSNIGDGVGIGDVNGDGIGDIIVSDHSVTTYGSTYVIFGGSGLGTRNLNSNPLTGLDGVRIDCAYINSHTCGLALDAMDINGNGIQDIVIGVPAGNVTGTNLEGYTYVVYGKKTGWPSTLNLETIY